MTYCGRCGRAFNSGETYHLLISIKGVIVPVCKDDRLCERVSGNKAKEAGRVVKTRT